MSASLQVFLEGDPTLDIEPIFTCFLKEELLWIDEYAGLEEAREKLSVCIDFYNRDYLHSALGYKSPQDYELLFQETNLEKAT